MSIKTAALVVAGTLMLMTTGASAAIVCNDEGDCWRVKEKYDYKPEFGLHVYGDNWKWGAHDKHKYHWREAKGRGYWRHGVWVGF